MPKPRRKPTSRDRVFASLDFQTPDRVPIDFWASAGFLAALRRETGEDAEHFMDRWDVDFRYIAGPRYIGPPLTPGPDSLEPDIWGVPRRAVRVPTPFGEETYHEVAAHPLAAARTPEEIDAYPGWPSPDHYDYTVLPAQCDRVRRAGRVAVFMGDRLNRIAQLKPAMYLRGIEQILVDMAESPELADALFRRIRRFYAEYLRRILESARGRIDIVLTGDDFGAQTGPLLSPAMWSRFLAAGFREYLDLIRAHDARSMHHTCGAVAPLVPLMADAGLHILQSLQPEALAADLPDLKRRFGGRLALQGGISIQRTMPHGAVAEIRREVESRVALLAPGGGYILGTAHNLQADCSVASVEALMQAYHDFGRCP
jgi:uroporphyrinogen decarboxylase